jgi:hypothetical protein
MICLTARHVRITGNPEVIGSFVGLVSVNALITINLRIVRDREMGMIRDCARDVEVLG